MLFIRNSIAADDATLCGEFVFCAVAAAVIAVVDDKITLSLQRRALPAHSTLELVRFIQFVCFS